MRILLTNNEINQRTGSELYLFEVARELQERGHEPICFSLKLGPLAERLIEMGIPVSDDLRALPGPPDVIHGQHLIETTFAAMTYRTVPVISFCHGPEAWQESGCQLPNVVRWVVVDHACRQRLVEDEKIDPEKITTLLNHFDDKKFFPRSPLPPKPLRALIMSNYLHPAHPAVLAVKDACAARGIELTTAGMHLGGTQENMGDLLTQFDLVFAKARTAIEVLAVGCAVVQIDHLSAGRLVRPEIYDEVRLLNFGFRSMIFPLTAEHLGHEIDLYDPSEAAIVSRRIREEATLGKTMENLIALYEEAMTVRNFLQDYDPILQAADFLRFQLLLSKKPMEAIPKSPECALRLPTAPIPVNALAATWENILAPHRDFAEREVQKPPIAVAEKPEHKEIQRLTEKVTYLLAGHAQFRADTSQKMADLKVKVAIAKEKNAQLKARIIRNSSPKKRSLLRRLGKFLGKKST